MIRRRLSLIVAFGILFGGAVSTQASASAQQSTSRYVVTFKDGVDANAQGAAMTAFGFNVARIYQTLLSGVAVDLTADQAGALAADPNVALVEPDVMVRAAETQSGANWSLSRIDQTSTTPDANYTYPSSAGAGVVVYVVDTGLNTGTTIRNLQHLDLNGRVALGNTWIQDGFGTDDCNGHGTHVAGTIAGTTHGVAKLATVIPARVLDCGGFGNMSDVVAALDWIAASRDHSKPTVVNVSLSGPASQTLDNVAARLFDSGVTVVVAAGNDEADACNYSPARASSVLTIGSTNTSDYRASFSNYGPCVDLFAPGMYIESASKEAPSAFSTSGGTSSSAAMTAGVAALILSANPGLSSAQVRDQIVSTATPGVVQNAGEGSPSLLLHLSAS